MAERETIYNEIKKVQILWKMGGHKEGLSVILNSRSMMRSS